jgi:hypothetical protein
MGLGAATSATEPFSPWFLRSVTTERTKAVLRARRGLSRGNVDSGSASSLGSDGRDAMDALCSRGKVGTKSAEGSEHLNCRIGIRSPSITSRSAARPGRLAGDLRESYRITDRDLVAGDLDQPFFLELMEVPCHDLTH